MGPGNDRLPPVDLVDVPEWLLGGLETQEGQPGIDDVDRPARLTCHVVSEDAVLGGDGPE